MAYGTNAPFGLRPVKMITNAAYNGAVNEYPIKNTTGTGYSTSLYTGDPVTLLADGTIGIGVAGSAIVGVFAGCKYYTNTETYVTAPFWPGSTLVDPNQPITAFVIDDPNVVYDIQVSNTANVANPTIAAADLNSNANFAVAAGGVAIVPPNPATGSSISGQSAYYLDLNSLNTTATLNLKIIGFTPVPGNIASLPFNNVLVIINNHIFKGGTGTAGV